MTSFDTSRDALRLRAAQRLFAAGVGISPPIIEPAISFNHVDGPVLHRLDATLHWLTWRERFAVWCGLEDAWSIERELQRVEYHRAAQGDPA